jgi:hypothetical protein
MNVTCQDRERIFEDGTPAEWTALEDHAAMCATCAEELRLWKSLSTAAHELRDYSESSVLWPRIQRALARGSAPATGTVNLLESWKTFWQNLGRSWQTALAGALVFAISLPVGWTIVHGSPQVGSPDFLQSNALSEVERAQSAYVRAIDKLAATAKPQLENPSTPLLANYREKLFVLDSAIDDLRAQAGENPSNAHVRRELLAMYQEKQHTLEEVLEQR